MTTKESLEREFDEKFDEWKVLNGQRDKIKAFFSSKYQDILKEVLGEPETSGGDPFESMIEIRIEEIKQHGKSPFDMKLGANRHIAECKSRASLRGFPVE